MTEDLKVKGDFHLEERPAAYLIQKYKGSVPESIIEVWEQLGFGTLLNGYLKIINPEDYITTVQNSFDLATPTSIPLFATAMGDLLVYHNNFLYFLDFRHGRFEVVAKNIKFFFEDIFDEAFLKKDLAWNPFIKAKERLGELSFDECFGYEPVLAAGGTEKAENLKKVKLKEYIDLIVQFAGKI